MVSAHLYIEGGGRSRAKRIRCREAFASLLKSHGFSRRMPRLTACGGCNAAFDDFKTAHANAKTGHAHGSAATTNLGPPQATGSLANA
jgi:hypothetical protein